MVYACVGQLSLTDSYFVILFQIYEFRIIEIHRT